jgi:hypothetical protein
MNLDLVLSIPVSLVARITGVQHHIEFVVWDGVSVNVCLDGLQAIILPICASHAFRITGKGGGGGRGEKWTKPCMHIWIIKEKGKKKGLQAGAATLSLFVKMGSINFFPMMLVLNHNPPDLHLQSSWDYRHELPCPDFIICLFFFFSCLISSGFCSLFLFSHNIEGFNICWNFCLTTGSNVNLEVQVIHDSCQVYPGPYNTAPWSLETLILY